MKFRKSLVTFCTVLVFSSLWGEAKEPASIVCDPVPLNLMQPSTITVRTSDLGSDVYLFAWINSGYDSFQIMRWEQAIDPKYKFSGNNGEYTMTAVFADLFGMPDFVVASVTQMGFIARSATDQTEDMLVDVVFNGREGYSGGNGSQANPYKISTPEDLDALASNPAHWQKDVHIELANDIQAGEFSGIGTTERPYQGSFNGNCHTISGLKITTGSWDYTPTGFFRVVDGARISGLGLKDAQVSGAVNVGVLAGRMVSGEIERCFTSGSVLASIGCAGGLVGACENAIIKDCYSNCSVNSNDGAAAGGFIGKNSGTISSCYSSGYVSGLEYTGGFVGANYGSIQASVAIPAAIGCRSNGGFYGRFGGNDNPENRTINTLAFDNIRCSAGPWGQFGHQSHAHDLDLTAQSTYRTSLGWDFENTWIWAASEHNPGRCFALLQGFTGQEVPSDEFFDIAGTEIPLAEGLALSGRYNQSSATLEVVGEDKANIEICNAAGLVVTCLHGVSSSDCSSLPRGFYIALLCSGEKTAICKFVR